MVGPPVNLPHAHDTVVLMNTETADGWSVLVSTSMGGIGQCLLAWTSAYKSV